MDTTIVAGMYPCWAGGPVDAFPFPDRGGVLEGPMSISGRP